MTTAAARRTTTRPVLLAASAAFAVLAAAATAAPAAAAPAPDPGVSVDFTASGYTVGAHSPRGQNGWNNTPADWDFSLVDNDTIPAAGLPAGGRSLQISNAIVPSSSRYLTSPAGAVAGEPGLTGVVGNTFTAEFTVASATGATQPGLNVDVNVDAASRYGGVVNLHHTAAGLEIGSYWLPLDAAGTANASWRSAVFATVPADVAHRIRIVDHFLAGQPDSMQVYVDDVLVSGGSGATTWEGYYAVGGSATDATVDQLSFKVSTSAPSADGIGYQTGIPAVPALAGAGYLFTDIRYAVTESAPPLPTGQPALPAAPDPAPDAALTVDATSGQAGSPIAFSADGFLPYENVAAVIHSTPTFLGWFQADAAGHLSGSVTLPAGLDPGAHTLQLTGSSSGFVASAQLQYLALAATGAADMPTFVTLGVLLVLLGATAVGFRARARRTLSAVR